MYLGGGKGAQISDMVKPINNAETKSIPNTRHVHPTPFYSWTCIVIGTMMNKSFMDWYQYWDSPIIYTIYGYQDWIHLLTEKMGLIRIQNIIHQCKCDWDWDKISFKCVFWDWGWGWDRNKCPQLGLRLGSIIICYDTGTGFQC